MNLPNYFLADLPPEATLSPAMVTEACQTLKRNRAQYLAHAFHGQPGPGAVRRGGSLVKAGQHLSPAGARNRAGENRFFPGNLAKGARQFIPPVHTGKFSCAAGAGIGRRSPARPVCHRQRGQIKSDGPGRRTGIAGAHRGGQSSEPGADEHGARPADPFGAVREMRAAVRPFCPGCSPIPFTTPMPNSARAWKSPNGAAAMRTWRRHCSPRPIA